MYEKEFTTWFNNIIIPFEGGISNRPKNEDPQGYTNHGVTIKTFQNGGAKLLNLPPTVEALSKLTFEQAQKIAYELYWKKNKVDTVTTSKFKPLVMDSLWLGGGTKSLGYKDIASLNADKKVTLQQLEANRLAYLKSLKNYEANKNGWQNRLNAVISNSLKISDPMPLILIIIVFFLLLVIIKN